MPKYTMIVIDNESKEQIDKVEFDQIIVNMGIKDETRDIIQSQCRVVGTYIDLSRMYVGLGRVIHDKFLEVTQNKSENKEETK